MSYSVIDLNKAYPLTEHDLVRMNVGKRFWHVELQKIPDACEYKKALKTWIARMPEMVGKGVGMLFHGEFRAGKTGAAVICLKALHTHGGTGYMIRADGIAGCVVNADRFDDEQSVEERCRHVDALVLDELVFQGGRGQTDAMIERLVRWRYDHQKPMIVTVNNLKGIEERYGQGMSMLLRSRCMPVGVKNTPFFEAEKAEVAEMFGDGK